MKHKYAAAIVATTIVAVLSSIAATAGAASPRVSARLFAEAGPVKMHANLVVTVAAPAAPAASLAGGTLSNCVAQAPANPRMGIATRMVCTNSAGQQVAVRAVPSSPQLTYRLAPIRPLASMQPATLEIRHGSTVVVVLSPAGGTVAFPPSRIAALLNGHDRLYVHVGGRTYHGKITRIA
jgi:hypothetical protein